MASNAAMRPRGRRPGHDDTRGTIRATAARLFHQDGYDKVSLRAVAREAGVDPALVHHYFASKADLFSRSVLGSPWDVGEYLTEILTGPIEQLGRRVVRLFLDPPKDQVGRYEEFLDGLRPDEATGSRATAEMIAREVFVPVAVSFGHSNAVLRAQLAASALIGALVGRETLTLPALAAASPRSLAAPLGHTVQYYLVDAW